MCLDDEWCIDLNSWFQHNNYISFFFSADSLNTVFDVIVDIGVPEVVCQFHNGPVASATCTIEYGNDPTHLNLPNFVSSTGTNVVNVTIPLSGSLQHDTLYYYVVSTMGVQMQGTFRTGMYHQCVLQCLL